MVVAVWRLRSQEETQNAFSDLLGVVCLSHSLVLENLVGLKSSCNKEPVIFSWGGSQGFWREDGFQWGTEWGSVVANRVWRGYYGKLTASQLPMMGRGGGGNGHKTITESFRGDQLNIIVTKPKSSVIPFISTFISRANTRFRSASPRIWSTLQCDQWSL